MTNVITFPGPRRGRIECRTSDLHEALWMVAFLLREHEQFVFDAAMGKVILIDDEGKPDPTVFGPDPTIIFADHKQSASVIVDMGRTIEGSTPLPAHMLVFFALWNCDGIDDPIMTYADAVETLEGSLWNIQDEKNEYFKKRGGAS